jgi:hypothetical protein
MAEATEEKAAPAKRGAKESGRKLNGYVHVTSPEDGKTKIFGPDDDVPEWAAELITNPKVWETQEGVLSEEPPVPGPNEFATKGQGTKATTKTELYALDKEQLVQMNEDAGIEASMSDSKQTLVENLFAR